jgi:hypothetical protein
MDVYRNGGSAVKIFLLEFLRQLIEKTRQERRPEAEIMLDRRGVGRSVAAIASGKMSPVSKTLLPRRTALETSAVRLTFQFDLASTALRKGLS